MDLFFSLLLVPSQVILKSYFFLNEMAKMLTTRNKKIFGTNGSTLKQLLEDKCSYLKENVSLSFTRWKTL